MVRPLSVNEGTVPVGMTPSAFAARVRQELGGWKRIAAEPKIVAEWL